MTINEALLDQLLKDYQKPEDILPVFDIKGFCAAAFASVAEINEKVIEEFHGGYSLSIANWQDFAVWIKFFSNSSGY